MLHWLVYFAHCFAAVPGPGLRVGVTFKVSSGTSASASVGCFSQSALVSGKSSARIIIK